MMNDEGLIQVTGREKNVISKGIIKIYPKVRID